MQFSIYINQIRAQEWGLNLPQSVLFSFLFESPSWAKPIVHNEDVWLSVSKTKIIDELPILTDKPDTIKRHMKALETAGLIVRNTKYRGTDSIPLFQLTSKAKCWNRLDDHERSALEAATREKNPARDSGSVQAGKKSPPTREKNPDHPGKKSPPTREKNPDNQPTNSYQPTNNQDITNYIPPDPLTDRDGIAMSDTWEPKPETLQRLQMHQGVPVEFARSQTPEFRMYWLTRGEKPRSSNWDTAFCQRIRSEWEHSKLEQAKQAQEPTWNPLDFDWTSWHLLPGGGQIDFGHIRHWMTCRMTARKVVTQDLINSLAEQLKTANLATGVPVETLVAEVANRNWVTIKAEWLVKSFEGIAGVSSTEALQARLQDTSW